jgi:transposase
MAMKFLLLLITLVRIYDGDMIQVTLTISSGVRIEYLPPYSPDLNPIEEAFSKIKHFLRRHQDYYLATTDDGILYDMYEVMDIITPKDAAGYYGHAGYF